MSIYNFNYNEYIKIKTTYLKITSKLIIRNIKEIMKTKSSIEKICEIISKRSLRIYWGTATTGAPHIAYYLPLSKLGDFLEAGCTVIILLADIHSFLDSLKTPWSLLNCRVKYYQLVNQLSFIIYFVFKEY